MPRTQTRLPHPFHGWEQKRHPDVMIALRPLLRSTDVSSGRLLDNTEALKTTLNSSNTEMTLCTLEERDARAFQFSGAGNLQVPRQVPTGT